MGVYNTGDLVGKLRTIKKDTVFSIYGYTYAACAVPGRFLQLKGVEPLLVTFITGGLRKEMEKELRGFLISEGINSELNV